ncbi:c-type cytochrome [Parabacteroides gordonii]|jgi:DNA-binding beta-propeller fold protein YncE|uniref:c-type cytochrome n=1 Tax=Parabacteroides gordonii TaxID=574930 RepID=UPI000EB979B3|nr:c-type cytochrome [Parabacteroides gordonii]RGP18274.1 cell surface protein [Parabacteroides gordonii]
MIMKINWTYIACLSLAFLAGCNGQEVFAPDHIWSSGESGNLLVANRDKKEVCLIDTHFNKTGIKAVLPSPANDLVQTPDRHIWVVCDGAGGALCELDGKDLSVLSETKLGHTPSAVLFNPQTGSLWTTQRFNNELWEVSPDTKEVTNRITVGREPVDIISFANDSLLLVANNLPEMSSLAYPIACQLDIVDVNSKKVVKRLQLPNGSTDVKALATDSKGDYAYAVHLLARYQLPTNQVDRGWMSTNVLSVINLHSQEVENTVLLDTPQKGASNPWNVVVSPDDSKIWISLSGTHELASVDRISLHDRLARVKAGEKVTPSTKDATHVQDDAGFLYGIRNFYKTKGKGPRALYVTPEKVYTANYYTGEMVAFNGNGKEMTAAVLGSPLASTQKGKGDMYFHDASIGFQEWQSCASCHPNDARMDGLNWDLMNDGMGNPKNTKTLVLSHQTPPCMISGIRKDAETAVISGIKYILFAANTEEIAPAIDTYLKSLSPVPSPYLVNGNLSEAAQRGKEHFEKDCASCHAGTYYTDMKQYKVSWTNGADKNTKMDVPALNEVWRTAPYLYDGRSYTMQEMLKVHGPVEALTENELNDLAEYVLSL